MTISVHMVPGSPFGSAVIATLREKSVPYQIVGLTDGLKSARHLALHPFARIPVIEHEGFTLYETQAILRYIDRAFPEPCLTPSSVKAAARMDQLMNINDWYLFNGVGNVIGYERLIKPQFLRLPTDENAVAAAMPKAHQVYDELERMLGSQLFFVGDSLTLADLILAPQINFFRALPEWNALTGHLPRIREWLDRMNERPSMQTARIPAST